MELKLLKKKYYINKLLTKCPDDDSSPKTVAKYQPIPPVKKVKIPVEPKKVAIQKAPKQRNGFRMGFLPRNILKLSIFYVAASVVYNLTSKH